MGTAVRIIVAVLALAASVAAAEKVVAVVNGAPLTARDLEEAVNNLIPRATFHGTMTEERRAEYQDRALEDLIAFELQYQDAVARGIKPDSAQVKEQVQRVRDSFPSKAEFKAWLERASLTEAQMRGRIERRLTVLTARQKIITGPSRMSDQALKDYYDKNQTKFRQPETIRLWIASSKSESKAKDMMERVRKGEDFGDVAARMSEDGFRVKGGDIGYVHRGRIYPAVEEAAFKLKKGDTAGPLFAEGAWFIVKAGERRPERLVPFDEAKEKLRTELEKKNAADLEEQWLSSLRAKAKIEVLMASSPTATAVP